MPDSKAKRGPADAKRVSLQPHELKYTANKVGCTQVLLKQVVKDLQTTKRSDIEAEAKRRMAAAAKPKGGTRVGNG